MDDELELVNSARKGEDEAFAELVRRYLPRVHGFLARLVGDPGHAEDLSQEVFLAAYRSLGRLRDPAGFRPWLFRIAINRGRDWIRARSRERAVQSALAAEPAGPGPPDPADCAAAGETSRRLALLVASLPDRYRSVILLKAVGGLSYREIAGALKIRPRSVETRLYRARSLLRQQWRAEEGEEP
ncbi:MAG: sigma-70 family RNA polymerase sigma factor [Acetobacteraceae bacterium]|nr:sigma-70 family RNA polymerase sigma factor [Acetobacteraceae bacterium]